MRTHSNPLQEDRIIRTAPKGPDASTLRVRLVRPYKPLVILMVRSNLDEPSPIRQPVVLASV